LRRSSEVLNMRRVFAAPRAFFDPYLQLATLPRRSKARQNIINHFKYLVVKGMKR